jgi:hypothetical protein
MFVMACVDHELSNVQRGRFLPEVPDAHRDPLGRGGRSRRHFIRAINVRNEYAARRSSAQYRPEALAKNESLLRGSVEKMLAIGQNDRIEDRQAMTAEILFCSTAKVSRNM